MQQHALTNLKRAHWLTSLAALAAMSTSMSANAVDEIPVAIDSERIAFEQIAPFVKMGGAWGNRATGPHGTFGEFPAGASSPQHTHTGAYHGVVVSGVMINPFDGESDPVEMGPGSYWYVPSGTPHVTACVSAEPCRFYFHADGAFDFTPIEP